MAGMGGFEPPKCESQSLVPYRLATSQDQSSIRDICNYPLGSKLRRRTLHALLNLINIYINAGRIIRIDSTIQTIQLTLVDLLGAVILQ